MIKTVSFAPPRQAGSRSSAKSVGASVVPVETLRPANPRPASGRTSPKTPKAAAQTSLAFEFGAPDEPEIAPVVAPEVAAPKAIKRAETAPIAAPEAAEKVVKTARKSASPPIAAPLEDAPAAKIETKVSIETKAPVVAKTGEVKAKRARVPKDLAAQYGEKVVERVVAPPVEAVIVKKRLNKIERQARRDLIKPSEDLMARLALANQIAARKPKVEPRGKGWKFVCGRCGTTSYFETPGGLCTCGTIAVKE